MHKNTHLRHTHVRNKQVLHKTVIVDRYIRCYYGMLGANTIKLLIWTLKIENACN